MRSLKERQIQIVGFALLIAAFSGAPALAGVNTWTSHGPADQLISALAIDPSKSGTLYAGTVYGRVFKSSDGGRSWRALAPTNSMSESVLDLKIVPSAPSTLYAGLSYYDGLIPSPAGVVKSIDGGAHWSTSGLETWAVLSLAVDPTSESTVYAGTAGPLGARGIQKSTDAGRSWTLLTNLDFDISSLVIDPETPSTLYASGDTSDFDYPVGGLIRSRNSGGTWEQILVSDCGAFQALAIDPTNTSTLYAGDSSWAGDAGSCYGLLKSTDGGSTWTGMNEGLRDAAFHSPSISSIVIDPVRSQTLFIGTTRGVFRSTDGGATWAHFDNGLTGLNVRLLAIDAAGTSLHAGTPGGVFDFEIASGPVDISVAQDGDSHFFSFDFSSGRLVFGTVDLTGAKALSQPYGPYAGWTPRASADGADGLTRILWNHEDGSAALWLAEVLGVRASFRYPAIQGLTAVDVAAGSDADTHILWTGNDGATLLQTIDAAGSSIRSLSLGPYSGWHATAIADGSDGLTRILWNNSDGRTGLSLASSQGILTNARFGPAAGWTALDVAVGGDGLTRILWAAEDGRITLWNLNDAGEIIRYGPIYAAPLELVPRRLAAGADGSSRVLFTGPNGSATLWKISADGFYESSVSLTPTLSRSPAVIAGLWTGTYNTNDFVDCDTGTSLPAQASFEQNGSTVIGTLTATGPCGLGYPFVGTLQGNALAGRIDSPPFSGTAQGVLSGATLEISVANSYGFIMGQLHLHR